MRTAKRRLSLSHAFLLLCLPHSLAFSPTPSVRTHLVKVTRPLMAPSPLKTSHITCRRRQSTSTTRLYLTPSASLSWLYMTLLALQFGCQPALTRKFTPKTITRSTVVLFQEVVKLSVAALFLWASGSWNTSLAGWSIKSWWVVAGIPAGLYVVQNYCALCAYQNLPPITFNVLNQTKTLSAALCCFLILGRRQSPLQIVSLFLLLLSALVIEKVIPLERAKANETVNAATNDNAPTTAEDRRTEIISGVIPLLMASFLSGLAGALSQKSLQTMGRDSFLFTMELSSFSLLFLIASLLLSSPDGKRIRQEGFFHGWTLQTWIPVVTNALGGIIVGLVTKYAGSVRKGFALIFGLLLSGILQSKGGEGVSKEQMVGGILAAVSLWMYSNFPVAVT